MAELAFFPGMDQTGAEKTDRMHRLLALLSARYAVRTIGDFAGRIARQPAAASPAGFRAPAPGRDRRIAGRDRGAMMDTTRPGAGRRGSKGGVCHKRRRLPQSGPALPAHRSGKSLAELGCLLARADHYGQPDHRCPAPRLFLWIVAMQGLYSAAALVVIDPDPFRLIGFANAIQTALAVMLFARLLMRDFSVDHRSAWLSAGLLGS